MNGIIRGAKVVIAATAMKSVKGAEKDTRVERMAEYIDKQDAIDIFKQFKRRKWISMPIERVIEIISVVPYVEAEPVRHGRWIVCDDLYKTIDGRVFDGYRECSVCGEMYPYFPEHNYCPNCGSRMDEVEE